MSPASIRRIARHLIQFPHPRRTKILSSFPSRDRLDLIEAIKRIKDDSPKNS